MKEQTKDKILNWVLDGVVALIAFGGAFAVGYASSQNEKRREADDREADFMGGVSLYANGKPLPEDAPVGVREGYAHCEERFGRR
jgi:hypothetical protein